MNETDEVLLADYDFIISNYYAERSGGKRRETWSELFAANMMAKPRSDVGPFLKSKGFALL